MTNSRWLRLYVEVYRDPKVARLSDRLFRFWINCLCLAADNKGIIPVHTDIAFHLRMPPTKVLESLLELKQAGFLDEQPDNRFKPHNWHGRQYESDNDNSTERVKRFRERCRNNDETFHETFQKRSHSVSVSVSDSVLPLKEETSLRADEFAASYPDQSDQNATVREYLSLVEPSEEEAVFACLERYKCSAVVARGAVMAGWKWLRAQKENGWSGKWERAPPKKRGGSFLTEEESLRIIEEA